MIAKGVNIGAIRGLFEEFIGAGPKPLTFSLQSYAAATRNNSDYTLGASAFFQFNVDGFTKLKITSTDFDLYLDEVKTTYSANTEIDLSIISTIKLNFSKNQSGGAAINKSATLYLW